ncbi:alpha-amylase family glycosyl hydrolase [Propionibacteriaceae bacterium Y1923]|uniref:alpha-amylase family glycosyl hydrolase n=1 Tax=Aestuariimicrobium sp. Y1814 TaxID=3418742 RepID=UPI003C1AC121
MGTLAGMGAILDESGAGFRVWAPNADTVQVVGDFNNWDDTANPLELEGDNGYWYGYVAGAEAGHEYRFNLTNGEQQLSKIDPYAQQVTSSVGNGIIVDHSTFDWQGDTFETPHHNNLVIYEMHAGTFVSPDGGVGTLEDVLSGLDHLDRLGINCIELMPVMEFAGDYSWGYNPAHIFAVESAYGGPDALKLLVREAHKRGISVIIDVVYNHFGPSDLDLWQFDGWSENDKGGIYFYNDWRSSTPWGDTRPDYGRGEVRQFIRDNALMWMREYHVQGLRYDMTPYMRSVNGSGWEIPDGWSLSRWVNDEVRKEYPNAILIAEDLHGVAAVTSTGEDGAAFSAQWDTHFVHPIRAAITQINDHDRDIESVRNAITYSYGDAFARVVYTESHDEVANGKARVVEEINPDDNGDWFAKKRSTLGAALVLTSPGMPMLFQGQEFLEGDWFRDDVPLDWDLLEDYHGIARLYRDLIRLRLNTDGVSKGLMGQHTQVLHAHPDNKVFAFHRWMDGGPGDDTVVVVNLQNKLWTGYRFGMPGRHEWTLRLNSDSRIYSDKFNDTPAFDMVSDGDPQDGLSASASVDLAPYGVLVYTRS